jgi:molybdate transport system ATP-binding protein
MSRLTARFDLHLSAFHLEVALDVPAAGITAVFGRSGSGKTTLLRCLAGLERAPNGFMRLGEEIWQDESSGVYLPIHRRAIGYVFQEPRLFPHLTVGSNLTYGFKRVPAHDRHISLEQVVEILGIAHLLERRPHHLSGGEQQRVAIGRALLTSPRLLLLDEPLSSLDSQNKREILSFIQQLNKALAIPTIYVSHSVSEILQLADLVALVEDGKLVTTGYVGEVFSRLDLHRHLGPHLIGAVIDTLVADHEPQFGLTRLEFNDQTLYVSLQSLNVGETLRVHILSSDVTLVMNPSSAVTSALNVLEGTVLDIREVDQTSMDVQLDVGCLLVASITKKSLGKLGLKPGDRVYAQIKAVALIEDLMD